MAKGRINTLQHGGLTISKELGVVSVRFDQSPRGISWYLFSHLNLRNFLGRGIKHTYFIGKERV